MVLGLMLPVLLSALPIIHQSEICHVETGVWCEDRQLERTFTQGNTSERIPIGGSHTVSYFLHHHHLRGFLVGLL